MAASGRPVDVVARRSMWFGIAICVETAIFFALPIFFLILGTAMIPYAVVATSGTANLGAPRSFPIYVELFLGWAGLIGLVRLLYSVWTRRSTRRGITALSLACGVGALLLAWYVLHQERADRSLIVAIVYLPMACTAHLVFLARRTLFG
jgi:hypothetical protein